MAHEIDRLKARRHAARAERDAFAPLIDEAYDYAIPFRRSSAGVDGQTTSKGDRRVDKVFDQTAIEAAFRGSGRLQQDLWPSGQQAFKLEPGPIIDAETKEQLREPLERISNVIGAMTLDGEFDLALGEMCLDLYAGTGAMLMLEGEAPKFARFVSVPLSELMLEGGGFGDVTGIFWTRIWTLRAVMEQFPKAKLDDETKQLLDDKPETEIELHQDTVWDPKAKRWLLTVWSPKIASGERPIHTEKFRTCPWLTPRYYRVSGEVYGRGPIMTAMPTIKTLNTAAKITLQAAAIAMLGIFTAVDDGVFNPDNSPIAPGVFWKVQRNGGALGPSVSRFPDPNIELSNLVMNDMRMAVKSAMHDRELPPDSAAVRSASEIIERVKRLSADHVGAYGRLVAEIINPLVRRLIEIAYNLKIIQDLPRIDQLLVQVRVVSPLATAREAERVQKIVQWLEMVVSLVQQGAPRVAKIEDALLEIGRALGIPENLLVSPQERAQMDEQAAAMQAAAVAAQVAAGVDEQAAAEAADPAAQPTPEMLA